MAVRTGPIGRAITVSLFKNRSRSADRSSASTAVKLAKLRLDPNARGAVIVKAEEQKQRGAARAKKAARPAAKPRAKLR